MNTEREKIYPVIINSADLNENHLLKPYVVQRMFEDIAEQHLDHLNLSIETTMKYDLAWALVALTVEFCKPVAEAQTLYAKTWYSNKRGPFFRREFVFENGNGDEVIKGATFSILLDMVNRSIFRGKEPPFSLSEPLAEFTVECSSSFRSKLQYAVVEERTVRRSYLDCLRHVNNCRYGEFAYDALTDQELDSLEELRRMEIYFQSELRAEEKFRVMKAGDEKQRFFRGTHEDGTTAFDVVFRFE